MKKLLQFKTVLIALILICACSATLTVKAQSTCATAVSFSPTYSYHVSVYNITDSIYWLKFVATDTAVYLKVETPNQSPKAAITHIYLYSGTCAGLTLIQSKGISDSLTIFQGSLTIGNTYYLKVNRTATTSAYFGLGSIIFGQMILHVRQDMCHGSYWCDTIMNYIPHNFYYSYHWGNTNPSAVFTSLSVTPIAGTSTAVFCMTMQAGVLVVRGLGPAHSDELDTFRIYACCIDPEAQQTFSDTIISSVTPIVLQGTYGINGTVIFNTNVYLGSGMGNNPGYFAMGPMAKIIVNPGYTFTIRDSSRIWAYCDTMWDGIYLKGATSNLIVKGNSSIQDGINAIVSVSGGNFNISASTLVNNYKNITAHYYNAIHPGRISNTFFNCNRLLLYPYHTRGTYIGIEADSVKKLFVGDSTILAQNHFNIPNYGTAEHVTVGIYGTDSYVYSYNNLFTNFGTNVHYNTQVGLPYFGIYTRAINANASYPFSKLRVGFTAVAGYYKINTFQNCEYGIQTVDSKFTSIYNNTFQYTTGYNSSHNNWGTAVYNSFVANPTATTSIVKNTFTTYSQAILVWNNNATSILCNQISLPPNPGSDPLFRLRGICTVYCQGAVISSNNPITGATGSNTDPNVEGLHVELGPGTIMGCNNASIVGRAIIFGGINTPGTVIYQNFMGPAWDGFYLNGVSNTNQASVGQQGAAGNPNDNQWIAPFQNSYTFSNYSNGYSSAFYVRTTGLPLNPTSVLMNKCYPIPGGVDWPVYIYPPTTGTSTLTCTSCSSILPANMSQGEQLTETASSELMDIAQGTSLSNLTNENKWLTKYFAYKDVLLNNILTTGALSSFMQANQSGDIGLLTQVNNLIESGNYSQALTTVSGIATTSAMAANLKSFYTLYAGNLAAGSKYILTPAQNATLVTMAQQCPYTYGPAVYHARAYLRACGDMTIYQNACEILPSTTSNAKLINPNNEQPLSVNVFPNPAKDEITISISSDSVSNYKVQLINLLGKIVLTENINLTTYSLSLKDIKQGVYICRVINNKADIIYNNKITVIK